MSDNPPQLIRTCKRCSQELAPGALACERCHALVHAEELEQLVAEAKSLEEFGDLRQAREKWSKALALLPQDATQAEWILAQVRRLETAGRLSPSQHDKRQWLAAPFLVSLALFVGFYWKLYGIMFGIGFAAQILLHEMGHFVDIKRRGLPADMPVFLPGLGAYVRWQALGVSNETRAAVSLAGPVAGFLAAATCALLWWRTGSNDWAELARVGALLNVLNLIPVWALDGGQAAIVLGKAERWALLIACLALWLLLGQRAFFLVAGGAAYRLFTKDMPAHPSRAITLYFIAVLASLGVLMWMLPPETPGIP